MYYWVSFIKNNQQKIALAIGYLLVAALFFVLGKSNAPSVPKSVSREEPPASVKVNDTANTPAVQSATTNQSSSSADCAGKIKGNISSSSKIYHMPGGAFYARTNAEMCFASEAEAQAAGFRKSSR